MKDHYVSKTYLNSFTNTEGYLIPYYKKDHTIIGKPKRPKTVCYEVDGDSNKYLNDPRIIDSYLPQFENHWMQNVQYLRNRFIDEIIKYQISGYIAFLRGCNPTFKRIGQSMFEAVIQPTADNVIERCFHEIPPEEEETRARIRKLIDNKSIHLKVDREFPHAFSISSLIQSTSNIFYGLWLILLNDSDIPFVTSDNPAVPYYPTRNHSRASIYVPISPEIAILIDADMNNRTVKYPLKKGISSKTDSFAVPKEEYIEKFNELIVKAAEERVFSNNQYTWLEESVEKFKDWRLECVVDEIPQDNGTLVITRQLVRKKQRPTTTQRETDT